ncbi:MAG: hypothetical protein Q8M65_12305, partial [Rhodoglobus sp.]|nr:hypothetical protein [Rhodoglobus sp.]
KKSNALVITLVSVGGVLLLAVVALAFLLIGRGIGGGTDAAASPGPLVTASSTSTPTPTPTETQAAPAPVDTSPRFTSFNSQNQVQCPNEGDKPEIKVNWATASAVEVWYTSGNEDAKDDNYMQVPLTGSQADFTDEHLFPCAHRGTQDYTITLVGPGGEHVSKHWTVTDLNWQG